MEEIAYHCYLLLHVPVFIIIPILPIITIVTYYYIFGSPELADGAGVVE
jgi:hypothetical protein